ncbi:MAG: hypothetical protein JRJ56_06050 [Deltaproteobacteria bacterium]|nr:hypothetical protein [Deltaproteobacteria bacterium]
MKYLKILLLLLLTVAALACASPQDKAYESQEAVNKERLELIDEYKDCMEKANHDKAKEAECERYLKAADALK